VGELKNFKNFKKILKALDALAREGIIHRDIKPDNVMVSHSLLGWQVKVIDFGIAKVDDLPLGGHSLTAEHIIMGTLDYLAPECAKNGSHDATPASDIYAIGVMMYEAVVGRLPHRGNNFIQILTKKISEKIPPMDSLQLGVPAELAGLIHRALEIEPEGQPSALEFLKELERIEGGYWGKTREQAAFAPQAPVAVVGSRHGEEPTVWRESEISPPPPAESAEELRASHPSDCGEMDAWKDDPPRKSFSWRVVWVVAALVALATGVAVGLATAGCF